MVQHPGNPNQGPAPTSPGDADALSRLPAELQRFVRVFLMCGGNLPAVEKELGISHSAACERLARIVAGLNGRSLIDQGSGGSELPMADAYPAAAPIAFAAPAHQQPIIDYAGPRPRQVTRLPASSVLGIDVAGNHMQVMETLKGKAAAVSAIVFALFTMAVMVSIPCSGEAANIYRGSLLYQLLVMAAFPGVPLLLEAIVMVLVIGSTWRRTVLRVGQPGLSLSMSSPFWRRHYQWTFDELQSISVSRTGTSAAGIVLGELQMLVAGREVRLFTDHEYRGLAGLAEQVTRVTAKEAHAPNA